MYFRVDMHSHLCFVIQYHNSFPFFPAMKIVAFSAKLTTDVNLGQDQTVAYNNVITNVGGAYDLNTGYFTSLVKGVYIFSASIFTLPDHQVHLHMVRNGKVITSLFSQNTGWDLGSQTIIVILEEGDIVWVKHDSTRHHDVAGKSTITKSYNTFSGALLQHME